MDSHAQAFLTATGIVDGTISSAINNLCIYLKKWGLFDKMVGLYPMVGGIADTHKYNLVNPADTDAAKRLTFAGGWTHSSTGALPNGTTGYADTHIDISQDVPMYNLHLAYYSRTTSIGADDYVIMGVGPQPLYIDLYFNSFIYVSVAGISGAYTTNIGSVTDYSGLLGLNSSNPLGYKTYRNTTAIGTNVQSRYAYWPVADPSNPRSLYLGAHNNNGTAQLFSAMQCAFASVGHGLSDTEWKILNNAVLTFEIALSRNV